MCLIIYRLAKAFQNVVTDDNDFMTRRYQISFKPTMLPDWVFNCLKALSFVVG